MLNIQIGIDPDTSEPITVSSEDVHLVVFPCSSFEIHVLWKQLQEHYGFLQDRMREPRVTTMFTVDYVTFLEKRKWIQVCLWCWNIEGAWVCFVQPIGDMFSYTMVEEWLKGHFNFHYEKGTAICDPNNIHNGVKAIERVTGKKAKKQED